MESSICDRAMSFLRYNCSTLRPFLRVAGACGRAVRAKRVFFFHLSISLAHTINLFYWYKSLNSRFKVFSRPVGARCVRSGIFFHGKLRMCKLCLEPKYLVNSLKNEVAVHEKVQTENLKIHSKPTSLKIVLWFLYLVSFLRSLRSLRNDNYTNVYRKCCDDIILCLVPLIFVYNLSNISHLNLRL